MDIQENILTEERAAPADDLVKTKLKWFNIPKGFGFVNPEDRDDVDAFLHITTLQDAGVTAIGEGASLLCQIEYGDKGALVKHVAEVIDQGLLPVGISSDDSDLLGQDAGSIQKMSGIVKWYKPEEGFGFIVPEDGMKDVFIHKTCLEKHGIDMIEAGQNVFMTFRNVPKGREVIKFEVTDTQD